MLVTGASKWQQSLGLLAVMQKAAVLPVVISYSAAFCACEKDQQWQQASAKNPKMMAEAFDKTIEKGLSRDPELVAAAVAAQSETIAGAVTIQALWHRRRNLQQ